MPRITVVNQYSYQVKHPFNIINLMNSRESLAFFGLLRAIDSTLHKIVNTGHHLQVICSNLYSAQDITNAIHSLINSTAAYLSIDFGEIWTFQYLKTAPYFTGFAIARCLTKSLNDDNIAKLCDCLDSLVEFSEEVYDDVYDLNDMFTIYKVDNNTKGVLKEYVDLVCSAQKLSSRLSGGIMHGKFDKILK